MKHFRSSLIVLFFLSLFASCQSPSVGRDLASYCSHDNAVSREAYWRDYEMCENH